MWAAPVRQGWIGFGFIQRVGSLGNRGSGAYSSSRDCSSSVPREHRLLSSCRAPLFSFLFPVMFSQRSFWDHCPTSGAGICPRVEFVGECGEQSGETNTECGPHRPWGRPWLKLDARPPPPTLDFHMCGALLSLKLIGMGALPLATGETLMFTTAKGRTRAGLGTHVFVL